MQRTVRLFLLLEGASFVFAGLVHFGVLARGYEHGSAAIAESVIGAVLLVALTLTWVLPAWARALGIAAQAFALLGTLVGAFTIALGVGPQTRVRDGATQTERFVAWTGRQLPENT